MIAQTPVRRLIGASVIFFGSSTSVFAAGFALIEVNATGQGNAYAGAAAHTENASTIFFNPAGLTRLDGEQLVFAAHYIDPSSDFDNDGSSLAAALGPAGGPLNGDDDDGGQSAFVPNFYWAKPLDDKTTFGLGVNSPFGLAIEYDEEWVGRYHAILSDLKTVNFNPSLGYRVNDRVSIGGGVNVMLAKVDLTSAVDFGSLCYAIDTQINGNPLTCAGAGANPQAVDGDAELDGDNFDDVGLGFNFGLMFELSDQTRVGVSYRSEIDIEVEGEANFTVSNNPAVQGFVVTGAGLFLDTDIEAEVTLPASFSVSVAHEVDKFTWLADVTWTGWESFDELRIEYDNPAQPDSVTTEDWKDSVRYSLGFDYQYSDKLVLRAGIALDETPVPNEERRTPRLPGNDRTWYSVGLGYRVDNTFSIDAGLSYLDIKDADIDNEFESSVPTLNHTLTGEYEADVTILSAQLNWNIE